MRVYFTTMMVLLSGLVGLFWSWSVRAGENDFILYPAKVELLMDVGETIRRDLFIINRLGRTANFRLDVEGFKGSPTGELATIFSKEQELPYSLKDFLRPEVEEFTLTPGAQMIVPINISVPEQFAWGGVYGAVFISALPQEINTEEPISFIGRAGTLFFVRVKGRMEEAGRLEEFATPEFKKVFRNGTIPFSILYRNTGNVHLNPYGLIEIKNILGKKLEEIKINPFFVMPYSLRRIEVTGERKLGFGWYTATLFLNRGYQDIVERSRVSFCRFSWPLIGGVIVFVCLGTIVMWRFVVRSFKKKEKKI